MNIHTLQSHVFRWAALLGVLALTVFGNNAVSPTIANAAGQPNCTYTIGYWKNHPEAWPQKSVVLGNTTYVQAAALAILNNPGGADATYQLAAQLIAAKLNVLKGADKSAIDSTITQADDFLKSKPYGSNPQGKDRDKAISLAAALENWNTGKTGPGHCDDEDLSSSGAKTATPTRTKTSTPAPAATNTPYPTGNGQICWQGMNAPQITATTSWTVNSNGTITVRVQFSKNFVDNTYGVNAIGWGSKGHTFGNLTGSDHVQLALYDNGGAKKMEFKVDYLTASNTVPSGYKTLGVSGGDGGMILGTASDVIGARTSLSENFNTYGYKLTVDSPATNVAYTPNVNYPNWIFDVWYEATVKTTPFGASGFGKPVISSVHASPSKTGNNTEPVKEIPCTSPTNTPTQTNTPAPNATNTPTQTATKTNTPAPNATNTPTPKTQPPCLTANVDGNYSEWNLATDYFASMYRAGDPTKKVESKLYLRYDAATSTLYALVLAEPGLNILANLPDDSYIKIGGNKLVDGNSGDDGTPPDFAWIGRSGDNAQGWEASAIVPQGNYSDLNVHTQVFDDGEAQTSAVANRAIDLSINCAAPTPTKTNTPTPSPSATPTVCQGAIFGFVRVNGNGLAGVEIKLKSGDTVLFTTQTNNSGAYLFQPVANGNYTVQITVPAGYSAVTPTAPSVTVSNCAVVQADFELAAFTPTPTQTNTPAPNATNTPTQTATPTCATANLCSYIRSPGFWRNYSNHMTDAQFLAILGATAHYSNLSLQQALAILDNTSDQYHRHLLSAELNAVWNGDVNNAQPGGPLAGGIYYAGGALNGLTVAQVLTIAFNTAPENASDDLKDAVNYLGANGETDGLQACRVKMPSCPTPTPVPPTNTPTKTNTPIPPTATRTNTPAPAPTNTPTNTPVPPTNTPTNTPIPPTSTPQICVGAIFGVVRANNVGVPNVTVTLKDSTNTNVLGTTTTDASGLYVFYGLTPGGYYVSITVPAGYTAAGPTIQNGTIVQTGQTCNNIQADFDLAQFTPTPTNTPVPAPTITPTPDICGNLTGAIFTTDPQGNPVNQNIYFSKLDVYLQGGPDQQGAHLPDGLYYYRVTDPSGQTILYPDGFRTVVVSGGIFPPTQLAPFNDSPNNGDEYKVWLSRVPTFDQRCTKTDNFKVRPRTPTPTNTPVPPTNTPTVTNTPVPNVCVGVIFGIVRESSIGVPNVPVALKDSQGNPLQTTATDNGGIYAFFGLTPGSYIVQITVPNGFTAVGPTIQSGAIVQTGQTCNNIQADFELSRHTPTPTNTPIPPTNTPTNTPVPPTNTPTNTPVPPTNTPTNTPVPPTNTPTNTPVPPTFTPTPTRTNTPVPNVCVGIIFGIVRESSIGVPNVPVALKDSQGNPLQTTATDNGGIYAFFGLTPGSYIVQITVPNGFTAVGPTIQSGAIVQTGQTCNNIQADFELARHTPTPTNTPVPPTNTPTNTPVPPTNTPTNTPVPPTATPTNTPIPTATRTNTPAPAPTLTPVPTATPVLLGNLCALVYHDMNSNAIRNGGEPLLPSAIVKVETWAGVFIGQFTTDGTEWKCFNNLVPGLYKVTETDPSGYTSTTSNLVVAGVTAGNTTYVEFGDKQQPAPAPTPTPTRTPAPAPPITVPGVNEPKGMASFNNRLFISSRNTNSVFVWDEVAQTTLKTIAVGNKPWGVAAVNSKIYVANNANVSVSVIDPTALTKTKDIKLNGVCDGGPANVAADTANNRVFVAMYGNRVAVIDATTDTLADCIPTAGGTFGIAYNPSLGQLYVSNRDDMSVQVFDVSTNPATLLQTEKLGGVPYSVEANLSTNEVYVSVAFNPPDYDNANNLEVFSAFSGGISLSLATITGNTHDGGYLRVSTANGAIYIVATQDNQLQVLDPVTLSVCATVNLTDPFGMTENNDLGRMYLGLRSANQIDIESNALCGGPPGGP